MAAKRKKPDITVEPLKVDGEKLALALDLVGKHKEADEIRAMGRTTHTLDNGDTVEIR